MIPFGVLANSSAILAGGVLGVAGSKILPAHLLASLTPVLGLGAMGIGMVNVIKLQSLPVVVLSLILGTLIGEAALLEKRAHRGISKLESVINVKDTSLYLSLVVLFCASGTGIFGSLHAGMSGDHSVLYTKSILDFFTAFSFAATLGYAVSLIALPQFVIQAALFYLAYWMLNRVEPGMIANFQAVGGLITFAIGIRILNLREMSVLNYTPALLVVFPLTTLFSTIL